MPLYKVDEDIILKNDPSVSSVDLSALALTDHDIVSILIPLLRKNNYIVTIDFSQNSIGDSGAIALAEYSKERLAEYKENSDRMPLSKIILDKNSEIQDEGGIALVQSPIPRLILSRTSVGIDTAIAAKETKQIELDLSLNNIDRVLIKQVNAVIVKNRDNLKQNIFQSGSTIVTKFFSGKHEEEHKTQDNTPIGSSTSSLSKRSDSE